jgi:opacity protein-like surface antigen
MKSIRLGSGRFARPLVVKCAATLGASLALSAVATPAHALVNVGVEGGAVKRSADSPNNLKLGLGYGVHGELDLLPLIKFGPYYLHYELSKADTLPGAADTAFNTLGLRARLMLPIPGSYKPYAFVGAGYTWVNYTQALGDRAGHFLELPIGVGLAYELAGLFHLSADAAYRPGVSFGGDAYNTYGISHPASGWSVLLGAAINL